MADRFLKGLSLVIGSMCGPSGSKVAGEALDFEHLDLGGTATRAIMADRFLQR